METEQKTLELVIDYPLIHEYNQYYFKKYPRRKKEPIARPLHESINVWTGLTPMAKNNLKQNWNEFIVWWVDKLGLSHKKIKEFEIEYSLFMPTRRRADPDNFSPKFILDGFVNAGMIVDDDSLHLRKLITTIGYDKEYPRTEIKIHIIKE